MKMASQEDLEFLVDRVPATNKVKGVSDYELEKQLSQNKMKMNFMNGVISWVDKNSELYQMGKDSRILNGVDRTKEIINYLESKGYTQSPDVPVYENKTITMSNEFKRMQELAGVKLQENYELEEEKYIGQFGSRSAENLAMAKAKFSNAVLALNSDDIRSAELAEETYLMLGNALKAHLDERFNK